MESCGETRRTPLAEEHLKLGARMVPFAGWEMPVQYSKGIIAEHAHTRESVSLFDICHMGEFRVKGSGAGDALDFALARPVADQRPGTCRYNFLLEANGGVIDDLIVYRISEDEFYIVVNAGTRLGDAEEFRRRLPESVSFEDESDGTAKLDLQGPESASVLERLGVAKESLPPYYSFTRAVIGGIECLLSRTGYTGELGFELYFPVGKAAELWSLLLATPPTEPAGLGARDTLRLEMGYPLYGHELDKETTPVEAGFGKMLKLDTPRDFIGSAALKSKSPSKRLIGMELEGRRAAREGCAIVSDDKTVGKVTSGAFSPSLGKAVAMGYVDASAGCDAGCLLELDTGRGMLKAVAASIPFHKGGSARKI